MVTLRDKVRNFMVSLSSVLAGNMYGTRILMILLVFVLWSLGQAKSQCWHLEILNLLDMIVSGVQTMMLCRFGMLTEDVDRRMMGWIIITIFMLIVFLLFSLALVKVVRHLSSLPTGPFGYGCWPKSSETHQA